MLKNITEQQFVIYKFEYLCNIFKAWLANCGLGYHETGPDFLLH